MKVWIDDEGKLRIQFSVNQEVAHRQMILTEAEAQKLAADIYAALMMAELKKEGALG